MRNNGKPPLQNHKKSNLLNYFESASNSELKNIESAVNGNRNNTLSKACFNIGTLFEGYSRYFGETPYSEYEIKNKILHSVALMNDPLMDNEAHSTMVNSFNKGRSNPRDFSELDKQSNGNHFLVVNGQSLKIDPKLTIKNDESLQSYHVRYIQPIIKDGQEIRFQFLKLSKNKLRKIIHEELIKLRTIGYYFSLETYMLLNIMITDVPYVIVFPFQTKQFHFNPNNQQVMLFCEGRSDLMALVEMKFHERYCLVSQFNKSSKIELTAYENIVILDKDNTPENWLKCVKSYPEQYIIKYIYPPYTYKDVRDWFNNGFEISAFEELLENAEIKSSDILLDESKTDIVTLRTANQRILDGLKQIPSQMLAGAMIVSQELHILFGDTGTGKTILAVSLSENFCKGTSFIVLENNGNPHIVIYYDFELSDKQFQIRYTNEYGEVYQFSENLYVDNIDIGNLLASDPNEKLENLIIDRISRDIEKFNPGTIFIDNITYLNTGSVQEANVALEIMRRLSELKRKYLITIIVIAHTPKIYNNRKLTLNDLAGSKSLANFADSISCFGKSSQSSDIRYWKQLKARSVEIEYDESNVITVALTKKNNFLTVDFIDYSNESEHLFKDEDTEKVKEIPETAIKAAELIKKGLPYSEVSKAVGISPGMITKQKKKFPDLFTDIAN